MAIVTCPHSDGMGACSGCTAEVAASMDRDEARARRRKKLEETIRTLEHEGLHEAARALRKRLEAL
jgi:hypothetical protein